MTPIAIMAAVLDELAPLAAALAGGSSVAIGRAGQPAWTGALDGRPVVLCASGLGKSNAAHALTALLEAQPVGGVLAVGVGGAYPGAGLSLRDLALASEEIFADEGVETPAGFAGCELIGLALADGVSGNRLPLEAALVARAAAALRERALAVSVGPFATVSTGSGTDLSAARQRERWQALVESMEGAALAQVARRYQLPFLELRAVSNPCGDRDRSRWDLGGAIDAACAAARIVLRVMQ